MDQYHHQRIDKGIERLKYQVPKLSEAIKRPLKSLPIERRQQIGEEVLARYIHGEQVAAIAPEYETSDVTLYALLLKDHQPEWVSAQTARALARLERHQEELVMAQDPLSLARARELVRSAQWELERLLSRLYGVKQEVTHTLKPEFNVILKPQELIIEGENVGNSGDKQALENHSSVMSTKSLLPKE